MNAEAPHGGAAVAVSSEDPLAPATLPRIVLVGSPNVGKSATFNALTGAYVTVSNYPGTTVEVSRGRATVGGRTYEVIDTPGLYGLVPTSDDERVARRILLDERAAAVVHIVDAKNLSRMLPLTLQLIEMGLPVILVLNMADEAQSLGFTFDTDALSRSLGVPVAATVAVARGGIAPLLGAITDFDGERGKPMRYPPAIEQAVSALEPHLKDGTALSPRTAALLVLQGDEELRTRFALGSERAPDMTDIEASVQIAAARGAHASSVITGAVRSPEAVRSGFGERLSGLMMNPWTGLPILAFVLYFAFYWFVGVWGAGDAVDFLESRVFGEIINPWVTRFFEAVLPWLVLQKLFVGEYGVFTLGVQYAVAIILPIVGTFFIAFSIIEDCGYLPRLAMLVDRGFKVIGLNGRAVIPIVLGFGCDTMATMVTRILETRREKIIATFLLSLAIPCSAQLGVILGVLAHRPLALAIWGGVIALEFFLIGFLAARLLPGSSGSFAMELPPLRLPRPVNVLTKTYARMHWYFAEIFPLFIFASVLIWFGQVVGLFDLVIAATVPIVRLLSLPDEASVVFLFGFFRRDYGAAGLFDLAGSGALDGRQLVVAAVTLTLFLPCVAQFLVMQKERGLRMTLAMSAFIFPFALGTGWTVGALLRLLDVQL